MKLDELTPWLFARTTGGIRWGLDRTRSLLAGVGDPHRHFHSLHIGGTNGKGSVAALCDAALRAARPDRRIGLYTSPHLVHFSERVRVDGRPLPDDALAAAAERLRPAIESTGASFFEATTAIAFLCFAEAGVDTAVVEVGLGGRLDATNVVTPLAAAITNVSLDHTEYLGETVEAIAREKGGILKPGIPAVTGETDPAVVAVLRESAAAAGAQLHLLDDLASSGAPLVGREGTRLPVHSRAWGERELALPLVGAHQGRNALLAAELLALLPEAHRPSWEAVQRGFSSARWPGRFQVERIGSTTWVFDVAHNAAGVEVLGDTLDRVELPRPLVLVTGILSDKDWRTMLPPLLSRADAAVLTVAPSAPATRRWDPAEAAIALSGATEGPIRVIPELADALHRASTLAPHGTVLVTGSFHTVGDAMTVLGVDPA